MRSPEEQSCGSGLRALLTITAVRSCPDELRGAGFSDIQILGDFTGEAATADHEELNFVCRK